MSLSVAGVWQVGVWDQTVWANGVWREGTLAAGIDASDLDIIVVTTERAISVQTPIYAATIMTQKYEVLST